MNKLLLVASSTSDRASALLADTYVDALREFDLELQIDRLDLWQEALPTVQGETGSAKARGLGERQGGKFEQTAWDSIVSIANRVRSADRYVIAAPAWDAGVPYRLKEYLGVIYQPGVMVGLIPDFGCGGPYHNKQATLFLTSIERVERSAAPHFGIDHQSAYLRDCLTQAGIRSIDEVRFEQRNQDRDGSPGLDDAMQRAIRLPARMEAAGRRIESVRVLWTTHGLSVRFQTGVRKRSLGFGPAALNRTSAAQCAARGDGFTVQRTGPDATSRSETWEH
ncbi:NAD(P)H-dependent oxidoreductase [Caballeronia insecticola]|uniref:NAD(P)H-dependent oxidoreductase n=1 Tax=Caballeronia insecticola TaxID=758793 RepID=UPI001360B236|nr:NAD(P)H-dependent oxidoreductase [Caballeronia insecticola]